MESYLTALPYEILLNILTNLDTFDVIDLCQTYPQLDQLLYDKNIIKNLRLFLEYRFGETHIDTLIFKLLETDRLMLISSLNINCVYWIKKLDLHRLISYLPALENLYAIDTKLSLTVEDCFVYNNLKQIKSIALTCADKFNWEHLDLFPKTITRMCWHIDETKYKSWNLTLLIRKLKHLEELWVINTGNNRHLSNAYKSLLTYGGLKKLVLCNSSSVIFPSTDLSPKTCVSFRRWSNNHQIVTERLGSKMKNDIYTSLNCIDQPGWDTYINRLKCTLPFGQNDAKLLILGINGIGDINYEELNLSHHGNVCSTVLKVAVKAILLNANVRLLRRLSINVCLFDDPSFEEIVGNCPLIEELEIWKCHSLNNPDALDCLQNLKQLTKLTADGLPDGCDMTKINKSLKSLRVKTGSDIFINLKHFSSLEDLRLEQPVLQLNAITEMLPKTVSRVLLKCDRAEFSTSTLKSFLLNNSQLKFFGVVTSKSTKKAIQRLSAIINVYKIDKRQCFFATENESLFMSSGGMPVPHVHKQQMMAFKNQVCCVDIFNGFTQY